MGGAIGIITNPCGARRRDAQRVRKGESWAKKPCTATWRSELSEAEDHMRSHSDVQVVIRPSAVAKPAGTPNNLIVTSPVVGSRALRANRSVHERRYCARCAREKGPGASSSWLDVAGAT